MERKLNDMGIFWMAWIYRE